MGHGPKEDVHLLRNKEGWRRRCLSQPLMYKKIAKHPTTLQIYSKKLIHEKITSAEDIGWQKDAFTKKLDQVNYFMMLFIAKI